MKIRLKYRFRIMRLPALILPLLLLLALSPGCISDAVSVSSSDILSFSADTVAFDTVFTGQGTPTARLKVFNRAKKGIVISSIRFRNPQGGFSMNVDGVSGKDFHDVEIRGGDSIFVFIECYVEPNETNEPFLRTDELEFVTNGVTQTIVCEAYGQNVTRLKALTLDSDMTLGDTRPYVIIDSLVVPQGLTLTVTPGARLLFHDKASLVVRGTLDARGAPGRLISMRGDRLDNVLPGISYDIMAGQWEGVRIAAESFGNRIEYVDMRSTVSGLVCDSTSDLSRPKLTLVNSWLHNSQSTVLKALYGRVEAYGVCFSEAAGAVVDLKGGRHRFSQCTIANNYLFSAISSPLLYLSHLFPEKSPEGSLPEMEMTFENGIIYSPYARVLNETDLAGSAVVIRRTLLGDEGSDDDNFIECLWDEDPDFCTVREDYYFNYHVRPDSPALGAGDPALIAPETETDIDGVVRTAEGAPTLGAYAAPSEQTPPDRR